MASIVRTIPTRLPIDKTIDLIYNRDRQGNRDQVKEQKRNETYMSVKLIYNPIRRTISPSVKFDGDNAVDVSGFSVDESRIASLAEKLLAYSQTSFVYPDGASGHDIAAIDDAEAAVIDEIKSLAFQLAKSAKRL